jgi:hypothetical protein
MSFGSYPAIRKVLNLIGAATFDLAFHAPNQVERMLRRSNWSNRKRRQNRLYWLAAGPFTSRKAKN